MKYAILFTLAAIALVWQSLRLGDWGFLLLWPDVTLLVVSIAYAGNGPGLIGKRPDGTMRGPNTALLLPYLGTTWAIWHLRRKLLRGACGNEVAPGLWLGRRPYLNELPPGITLVFDLTAEFPADHALTGQVAYCCLPVLDDATTNDVAFSAAVMRVAREAGPVYVHCALGHGRSASLVAAVLIVKGIAADVESAEVVLRRARPAVRLNRRQRQQVARITSTLSVTGRLAQ